MVFEDCLWMIGLFYFYWSFWIRQSQWDKTVFALGRSPSHSVGQSRSLSSLQRRLDSGDEKPLVWFKKSVACGRCAIAFVAISLVNLSSRENARIKPDDDADARSLPPLLAIVHSISAAGARSTKTCSMKLIFDQSHNSTSHALYSRVWITGGGQDGNFLPINTGWAIWSRNTVASKLKVPP